MPAARWKNAYPVGNGRHGALVRGDPWAKWSSSTTFTSLNYRTGVAAATWREAPGQWQRSCFVSRARDVVVQSLTAPPYPPLDLTVELDVGLPGVPPGLEVSASLLDGRCAHFAAGYPHQLWTAGADWLLAALLGAVHASEDEAFWRECVWPAFRELAMFYEDFLARTDEDGHVIYGPSYSPENAPHGWSPAALNATMDIAAARHALLAAAVGAVGEPGRTDEERRWRELANRLPPYRVNADAALAEWAWPPAGSGQPPLPDNYDHRHISPSIQSGHCMRSRRPVLPSSPWPRCRPCPCAAPRRTPRMATCTGPWWRPGSATPGWPGSCWPLLLGAAFADLRWDLAAGRAEAILVAQTTREIAVACRQRDRQRLTLPATRPSGSASSGRFTARYRRSPRRNRRPGRRRSGPRPTGPRTPR